MADVAAISASKDKAQASFANRACRHHRHPRLGAGPAAVRPDLFPPPEPLGNVLRVVVVIIVVLVVIGILLDIEDHGLRCWVRVKNAAGAARAVSNEVTIVAAALPEQHCAQKKGRSKAPPAHHRQ